MQSYESLICRDLPQLDGGTLLLAFTGWMDGGHVSTGSVNRLVEHLEAGKIAEIDPELFYIYNFPGSMEITALFRPGVEIEDGLVKSLELPKNDFYCHEASKLILFVGREPNLRWRTFGDCIFHLCCQTGISRILFVGSFGGAVPHTRQPRLYITCSAEHLLEEMEQFGLRRSGYSGPGSFTTYLMSRAPTEGIEMTSLVAEIPGYLEGRNPAGCFEAVLRRLAKMLRLPLDLHDLPPLSTEWELQVSSAVEDDDQLAEKIRTLEEAYDNELLQHSEDEA